MESEKHVTLFIEGREIGEMETSSNQQQVGSIRGRLLTVGLFFIGLMACLAIGVSTAQAQTYNIKNMGILDGMKACEPAAMNNAGQVAGTATAGELHAAFLYYYNGTWNRCVITARRWR